MLQRRWEKRYRAAESMTIEVVSPRSLSASAALLDISPNGMAIAPCSKVSRNAIITLQYERSDVRTKAMVVYQSAARLGLLVSLIELNAKEQHMALLERCRASDQPFSPD